MSLSRAKEYLAKYGKDSCVMEFSVSSATVPEAAAALGCREEEIAKTLSFLVPEGPVLIVAAGDAKIDNAKFKAQFHTKAKMIPATQVEALIGHAVGGVCPFGINEGVGVYLDESLKRLETVYPACGSASSAIRLTVRELEQVSGYTKWVDVCKLPSGAEESPISGTVCERT